MALESTIISGSRSSWLSGVHPVAFRKACISGAARSAGGVGSVVETLADLVDDKDDETKTLALQAIEAIAIDDPSTDTDNHHALAICATSVVPRIIRHLSSSNIDLHTRAAGATASLVENAHCAKMFVGGGVVVPLVALAREGTDAARKHAISALRMLSIDRDARESIVRAGVKDLLSGLARHASSDIRAAAREFSAVLDATVTISVDATGHAKAARATRVAQSKLWRSQGSASRGTNQGLPRAHNANTAAPGLGASKVLQS